MGAGRRMVRNSWGQCWGQCRQSSIRVRVKQESRAGRRQDTGNRAHGKQTPRH
ncbi:unnamed protein product [Staurois parvus]|uniref:Uncharacterized protein n=1 Tax=Staurois parvus TaxID=386267 RepID=A0ABN9CSS6_9NEOB|nr:unnamed protein product [Staurois parvus]